MQGINISDEKLWNACSWVGRKFHGEASKSKEHAEHIFLIIGGIKDRFRTLPFVIAEAGSSTIEQIERIDCHGDGRKLMIVQRSRIRSRSEDYNVTCTFFCLHVYICTTMVYFVKGIQAIRTCSNGGILSKMPFSSASWIL